jgi:hypothetical protein
MSVPGLEDMPRQHPHRGLRIAVVVGALLVVGAILFALSVRPAPRTAYIPPTPVETTEPTPNPPAAPTIPEPPRKQ